MEGKERKEKERGEGALISLRYAHISSCSLPPQQVLKMKDDSGKKYKWTRQMYGTAWPRGKRSVTPQQAQRQMQSLMGYHYDLIKNNCHLGQERLRRYWGMHVAKPYSPKIRSVCSCRLPKWLSNDPLNVFLQLVRRYCRRRG